MVTYKSVTSSCERLVFTNVLIVVREKNRGSLVQIPLEFNI